MPFFIDYEEDQRCHLVEIQLAENKVDLYDRPRDQDTSDISEIVLQMLTIFNKSIKREFEEEDIDGGV